MTPMLRRHLVASLALLLVVGVAPTAVASECGGSGGHGLPGLLRRLDLTPSQRTQIDAVLKSQPASRLRREAIMPLLTPDQQSKLHSLEARC